MKHVFTDISTIAHMWANQTQDSARNSGNFYFEGNTIYSYGSHFPIAKHVVNSDGINAVLFTKRRYSNTTAKHIHVVRQAASHKNIIYCYSPNSSHSDNFKSWLNDIEDNAAYLKRAKKPEIYLNQIGQFAHQINMYATFFGVEIPETLKVAMAIGNKEEYVQYAAKKEEYEKFEAAKAKAELEKRHKKELSKWLNGEGYRLYTHNGYDYLRVKDSRIETSQGVELPMELGRKIYNQLVENKLKVGSKILSYEVNAVGKEVKVGCHTFKTDYLLKFGAKL